MRCKACGAALNGADRADASDRPLPCDRCGQDNRTPVRANRPVLTSTAAAYFVGVPDRPVATRPTRDLADGDLADPPPPFRMSKVVLPSMDAAQRKVYEKRVWASQLLWRPASRRDSAIAMLTVIIGVAVGLILIALRS